MPQTKVILHKFNDSLNCNQNWPQISPQPSTPAFIMYTSGTTGNPKGCVITHANFISTAASIYVYAYPFSRNDRMLSYLPLAHVYESVQHVVALKVIGRVAFYSGKISRLNEEINLFKPTIICGVTRVFERIYNGIQKKLNAQPFYVRALFNSAFHTKSFLTHYLRIRRVPLLDNVFNSVCDALGGCVRLFVCGGSALPEEIQCFLRICCRASFVQGYGLTESTSSVCVQTSTDVLEGNCGALLPWAEVKLKTVDQYKASDMSSELLVRGSSIFNGYYKDEEATKSVFTNDGFFMTGDIFKPNKTGQLVMIGRRKEFVKLSQGEYISLQKLYDIYETAEHVKQIYIHAGLTSRFLVAIVVPDDDKSDHDEILNYLDKKADENNLLGFERIKDVFVTYEEFTTENGLITPSLKIAKFNIQKKYGDVLKKLNSA